MHDHDDHPTDFPPAEESIDRLRRSGWSMGESGSVVAGCRVYVVDGRNGENRILAEGATAREVWWRACEQAAVCRMLRDWPRPSSGAK
jgi:hypothetical protein